MPKKKKTIRRSSRKTTTSKVKRTTYRKPAKRKPAHITRVAKTGRQYGYKQTSKGVRQDKKLLAKRAGRRVSASGNVYYEHRPNRSDLNRKTRL